MPRLFDMLSEKSDKTALAKMLEESRKSEKKQAGRKGGKRRENRPEQSRSPQIPNFVAIDLETTGLEYRKDKIIEVGLVRFINGKAVEEFSSFVNPGIAIPRLVTDLTGIEDHHVSEAPVFESLAKLIVEFLGEYPLCAHQADFDHSFLCEELKTCGGKTLRNALLDTAVLSRLALPGLTGYSLGLVAEALKVRLDNAHRALDDARASGEIAAALIPLLSEIPTNTLQSIARFSPASVLKTILVRSVGKGKRPTSGLIERVEVESTGKLTPIEPPSSVGHDEIEDIFSQNGTLSQIVEGYKPRQVQRKMAAAVTNTLNDGRLLVAEAGTGTGKSLAYLIPSSLWALRNDSRVLISTRTRNLQDQLIGNELPLIRKALGRKFRYAVLKGRSNYLCRNRWTRLTAGEIGNLSRRERFGVLPLIRWADETRTGDIEEQNQFNRKWFPKVWNLVSADSHDCLGRRCSFRNECFLQSARRSAQNSHIVVINHSLFFSDVCAESSFLGRSGPMIFDEAHHLEAGGHSHLRVEFDTNRMNRFLESCTNLVQALESIELEHDAAVRARKLKSDLKRMRKSARELLDGLMGWVMKTKSDVPAGFQYAITDKPFDHLPELPGFYVTLNEMRETMEEISRFLDSESETLGIVFSDVQACTERAGQLRADVEYLTAAGTEEHTFWIEGNRERGWVKLCGVPLDIGGFLGEIWKRNTVPVIFTSATLSVDNSLEFFREKVGLTADNHERTDCEIYPSPYADRQTLRCVLHGSHDPDEPDYTQHVADCIVSLQNTFKKNMLVLFTSNSMLQNVGDALKAHADLANEVTVLAQGPATNRAFILERFRVLRRAVLLGTESFWEGVNAPGESCEMVVIPRLPFAVPTHPLTQALAERYKERYGDSFFSFVLPEAAIRLRQGAGRLIRSPEDRGLLLILDRRIVTKGYGKVLSNSLGGRIHTCRGMDELTQHIDVFFNDDSGLDHEEPRYVPFEDL